MKLQSRQTEEPELNLTSLIDVVLLLLIFFMVSTSFVREAELKVQLPEASIAPARVEQTPLEVTITSEGDYLLNGEALVSARPDILRRAIEQSVGEQRDMAVTIRADARATHQSVVTVMDVVGKMGFVNITIVTSGDESNE